MKLFNSLLWFGYLRSTRILLYKTTIIYCVCVCEFVPLDLEMAEPIYFFRPEEKIAFPFVGYQHGVKPIVNLNAAKLLKCLYWCLCLKTSPAKYIMQYVCFLTALQTSHQKKTKKTCRAVMHAVL